MPALDDLLTDEPPKSLGGLDDLLSDSPPDQKSKVQPEGVLQSFLHPITRYLPTSLVTAGAGVGAGALASETGPGAIFADIAAGTAAGAGYEKAREMAMTKEKALEEEEQLKANEQANPWASKIGTMVGQLPAFLGGGTGLFKGAKIAAKEAGQVFKPTLMQEIASTAIGGGRAGGAEAAGQQVAGTEGLSIPEAIAKGAITMGPLGFVSHVPGLGEEATSLIGKILQQGGHAATASEILAHSNALYNSVVHGAPYDEAEVQKSAIQDVPAFLALGAGTHVANMALGKIAPGAKPVEAGEEPQIEPETEGTLPQWQNQRQQLNDQIANPDLQPSDKLRSLAAGIESGHLFVDDIAPKVKDAMAKAGVDLDNEQEVSAYLNRQADRITTKQPTEEQENAVQEPSPSGVLQHPQEGTGEAGGERAGVEPSIEGNAPAETQPETEIPPEQNPAQQPVEPLPPEESSVVQLQPAIQQNAGTPIAEALQGLGERLDAQKIAAKEQEAQEALAAEPILPIGEKEPILNHEEIKKEAEPHPVQETPEKQEPTEEELPPPKNNEEAVSQLNTALTRFTEETGDRAYKAAKLVPDNEIEPRLKGVIDAFQDLFNRRVVVVKPEEGTGKRFFYGVRWGPDKRTMYLNAESAVHPIAVMGHEFMHSLQETHPDLYKDFLDGVKTNEVISQDVLEKYAKDYFGAYMPSEYFTEALHNAVGDRIFDGGVLTRLAEDNPNLFRKIADAIHRWIQEIRDKLVGVRDYRTKERLLPDINQLDAHLKELLQKVAEVERPQAEEKEESPNEALKEAQPEEPSSEEQKEPEAAPVAAKTGEALKVDVQNAPEQIKAMIAAIRRMNGELSFSHGEKSISEEKEITSPEAKPAEYFRSGRDVTRYLITDQGLRSFKEVMNAAKQILGKESERYVPSWYSNAKLTLPADVAKELEPESKIREHTQNILTHLGHGAERDVSGAVSEGGGSGGRPSAITARPELIPQPRPHVGANDFAAKSGFRLDHGQTQGVNLILDRFKQHPQGASFLLADGPGFGKTAQLIAVSFKYLEEHPRAKVLIVTQNKTIADQRFKGDANRMGINLDDPRVTVTTYSKLNEIPPAERNFDLGLWDEAHNLKNAEAQKSLAAQRVETKHNVFATATPMDRPTGAAYFLSQLSGEPEDVVANKLGYHLAERVDPRSGETVVVPVLNEKMSWANVWSNIMAYRDHAVSSGGMIRREYPFYGDIKDYVKPLSSDMVPQQKKINDYYNHLIEQFPNKKRNLEGARLGELRRWSEVGKLDDAVKLAKEHIAKGGKVIIVAKTVNPQFYNVELAGSWPDVGNSPGKDKDGKPLPGKPGFKMEGAITQLEKKLNDAGINNISHVHSPGDHDIPTEVRKFQDGGNDVALATPQSGGTGIDLDDQTGKKPRLMIVLTREFAGDQFEQLMGRISRKNTASPAEVRMLTNSDSFADQKAENILNKKMRTLHAIKGGEELDVAAIQHPEAEEGGEKRERRSGSTQWKAMVANWKKAQNRGAELTPYQKDMVRGTQSGEYSYENHPKPPEGEWVERPEGQKGYKKRKGGTGPAEPEAEAEEQQEQAPDFSAEEQSPWNDSHDEDDLTIDLSKPKKPWEMSVDELRGEGSKGKIAPHTGVELQKLVAGEKPAAILPGISVRDSARAHEIAKAWGVKVERLPGDAGWMAYLNEDAAERLAKAYEDHMYVSPRNGSAILDPLAHADIGKALGYSDADIKKFYDENGKYYQDLWESHMGREEDEPNFPVEQPAFSEEEPGEGEKEEEELSPDDIMYLTHDAMDRARAAEGMAVAPRRPYMNIPDTFKTAEAEHLADPTKAERIVHDMLHDDYSPSVDEQALLTHWGRILRNNINKFAGTSAAVPFYDKWDQLTRAVKLHTSKAGQTLRLVQEGLKEDFTLAGLMRRASAVLSGKLSTSQREQIEKDAREFKTMSDEEKENAYHRMKRYGEDVVSRMEKEVEELRGEETSWINDAMDKLSGKVRDNAQALLDELYFLHEAQRMEQEGGAKFSHEIDFSKMSRKEEIEQRLKARLDELRDADPEKRKELINETKKRISTIGKDLKDSIPPEEKTTKPAKPKPSGAPVTAEEVPKVIKAATEGDKVAMKMLEHLSTHPSERNRKAPDPVRIRYAKEVRDPGDRDEFVHDLAKHGVSATLAEQLHGFAMDQFKENERIRKSRAASTGILTPKEIKTSVKVTSIRDLTKKMLARKPTDLTDIPRPVLRDVVRNLLLDGKRGEEEITKGLHDFVKSVGVSATKDDVREYAYGYGESTEPSQDELEKELRHIRAQSNIISSIERLKKEIPTKKTGPQRDKATKELRDLYKQLKDTQKEMGVETRTSEQQLASVKDAIRTRLKNDIEDLEDQIAKGKRVIRSKRGVDYDEDMTQLKAQRAQLMKELDDIDPKAPISDEEKERRLIKAAQKSAERWEQRRKDEEWEMPKGSPPSQKVIEARQAAAEAKEAFEQARDLKRPDIAAKKELDARVNQLNAALKRAKDRLIKGKEAGKGKVKPSDEWTKVMEDEITRIREAIHAIEGDPRLSPEQRTKNAERATQRAIDALQKQIDAKNFEKPQQEGIVESDKLKQLRQDLNMLKEIKDAMQYVAKPSPEELALKRYKRMLGRREDDIDRRIRENDFSKPVRKQTQLDEEAQKIKLRITRKQREFNAKLHEWEEQNRTPSQKFWDFFPKLKRFSVLSSPVVFGKLAAASLTRGFTTALEEVASGAWNKILPSEFSKKARLEGGMLGASGIVKAVTRAHMRAIEDSRKTLGSGESDLDVALSKKDAHGKDIWGLPGRLHAMMKAPIKRTLYEHAFEKLAASYIRDGHDPADIYNDELLNMKISQAAYKAANRGIFLQDNALVDAWNAGIKRLEGMKGTSGPGLARLMNILMPIVRVPTNIVMETAQYAGGLPVGLVRLAKAWKNGFEHLSEDEADSIQRLLKKGSLGSALMLLGFYSNGIAGGYYNPDERRRVGEPKIGGFKLFGVNIPQWLTHSPAFEAIQFGATMRRAVNNTKQKNSIPSAAWAATVGLAEETPFLNEMWRMKEMQQASGRGQFFGELARSQVEPEIVQKVAQWTDRNRPLKPFDLLTGEGTQARAPKEFGDVMKAGLPILRKQTPLKIDTPFSPTDPEIPDIIQNYSAGGGAMPTKPERAPLEKKNGPLSKDMWENYAKLRGNAMKREMMGNMGYLMSSGEEQQKQRVREIAAKASYEAKSALGLK